MKAERPSPGLIVIADTFTDEREMYASLLCHKGYEVFACERATEALRIASEGPVAAVITRIVQPAGADWDGIELTRRIKEDDRTKHIPVIIITTRIEPHLREAAEEAGCDSFLLLPCGPETIASELHRLTQSL